MEIEQQHNAELEPVARMVKDIGFAMMTTVAADGTLHSRPMSTMQMDAEGNLWFFTSILSPKMNEATEHSKVALTYAKADIQDFVAISGTASVVRDKAKMLSLWTPWIKPWFPRGVDDPDLALLKVSIDDAQYWDAPGSAIKRAFGLAKALVTHKTDGLGENRTIHVRH
jgi:general stress protein 26